MILAAVEYIQQFKIIRILIHGFIVRISVLALLFRQKGQSGCALAGAVVSLAHQRAQNSQALLMYVTLKLLWSHQLLLSFGK